MCWSYPDPATTVPGIDNTAGSCFPVQRTHKNNSFPVLRTHKNNSFPVQRTDKKIVFLFSALIKIIFFRFSALLKIIVFNFSVLIKNNSFPIFENSYFQFEWIGSSNSAYRSSWKGVYLCMHIPRKQMDRKFHHRINSDLISHFLVHDHEWNLRML